MFFEVVKYDPTKPVSISDFLLQVLESFAFWESGESLKITKRNHEI